MIKKHHSKLRLSEEEVKQALEFQGAKLSFFISRLNLTEAEKEKLFNFLATLSLEQLLIFTENLENIFVNEQTQDVDQDFIKKINDLKTAYEKESHELSEKVISQLDEIEQRINQGKGDK